MDWLLKYKKIEATNDILRKAKASYEDGDEDAFAKRIIELSEIEPVFFEDLR